MVHTQTIFDDAVSDHPCGINIIGMYINNIMYAEDTVLIATSIEELQSILTE